MRTSLSIFTTLRRAISCVIVALGLTQGAVWAAPIPSTIKVLHWNTWLIPGEGAGDHMGMDNADRLVHMAARINSGSYDIVTLNEVFAKAVIEDGSQLNAIYLLTGRFPTVVDQASLEARYNALVPDPGGLAIKPIGQYKHFAAIQGFKQFAKGDAGLFVATTAEFPPLPRTGMTELASIAYIPGTAAPFYCFGRGEVLYRDIVLSGWDDNPVVSAPDFSHDTSDTCGGAFSVFLASDYDDAMASKGVAWVRVLNTKTGRPLNIFLTHAQADYPDESPPSEYVSVRAQQLQQMRDFVAMMAPAGEDVIFAGDFNIFGDGLWPQHAAMLGAGSPNAPEYDTEIVGNFGAVGFKDAFRDQLKPTDIDGGYTRNPYKNGNNNNDPYPQRLDYILAKWLPGAVWQNHPYCIQHTRVRRDLNLYAPWPQAGMDPSDHFPVEMTLGMDVGYCAPRKAFDLATVPATDPNKSLTLTYKQPQTMQWLRVPAFTDVLATANQGISTIGGPPSNMLFEAFKAADISLPLKPFGGNPVQGPGSTRDLKNGVVFSYPFDVYVKITPTDPTFVGTSQVLITRLNGADFNTAIPIGMTGWNTKANKNSGAFYYDDLWKDANSRPVTFVGTNIPGQIGQQEMWFRYNAEVLSSSKPHCVNVHFLQEHTSGANDFNPDPAFPEKKWLFKVTNAEGVLLQAYGAQKTMPNYANSLTPFQMKISCFDSMKLNHTTSMSGARFTLKRAISSNTEERLRLAMTIPTRGAKFLQLQNLNGNDELSNDEPVGQLSIDGGPWTRVKSLDLAEPGSVDNWIYQYDAMPAGQTVYNAHFTTSWSWQAGEDSGDDDALFNTGDIDWFTYFPVGTGGVHRFSITPTGVIEADLSRHHFNRLRYATETRMWLFAETGETDAPQYRFLVNAYMPGGIAMEAEE